MPEFDFDAADQFIAAQIAGSKMACAVNCAWCCHQLIVMTNRNDGVLMLDVARQRLSTSEFEQLVSKIREQAERISQLRHEDAEARQWTCPFLRDKQCLVYEVRPIACRSVFSPDASCCQAMMQAERFEDLSEEQQRLATEIGERAMALQFAINDRRPVTGAIEMRQLLVEILEELVDE